MLKAASEIHQEEILDYVINKKNDMSRTSLRHAIEKIPEEMRKEAIKQG